MFDSFGNAPHFLVVWLSPNRNKKEQAHLNASIHAFVLFYFCLACSYDLY